MQWAIVQLLPKPQMSKSRSSTIRVVVERPDHHCGDNLVTLSAMQCQTRLQIFRVKNISSVFELSGVAFRLALPYGGLRVQILQSLHIRFTGFIFL